MEKHGFLKSMILTVAAGIFLIIGNVLPNFFSKPEKIQITVEGSEKNVSLTEAFNFYKSEAIENRDKVKQLMVELQTVKYNSSCDVNKYDKLNSDYDKLKIRLNNCLNKLGSNITNSTLQNSQAINNYKSGLSMFVYQFDKFNLNNMPVPADGVQLGELVYKKAPTLKFDAIKESEVLSRYYMDPYGIKWSGYLAIEQIGNYLFSTDISVDGTQHGDRAVCKSYLKINNKIITNMNHQFSNYGKETKNAVGQIELSKGLVPVDIWLVCDIRKITNSDYTWDNLGAISATINMKGPNDKSLAVINGAMFYH